LSHLELGRKGEDVAAKELKRRGYKVVDRNVVLAEGEIDLIAREGGQVVFVEVKTRSSDRFGAPQEAVDRTKQRRLTLLASRWLKKQGLSQSPARFDVVSVRLGKGEKPQVEIFRNAFEACE